MEALPALNVAPNGGQSKNAVDVVVRHFQATPSTCLIVAGGLKKACSLHERARRT
jgi:hypothetical protein